jgi:hypothetical protein
MKRVIPSGSTNNRNKVKEKKMMNRLKMTEKMKVNFLAIVDLVVSIYIYLYINKKN